MRAKDPRIDEMLEEIAETSAQLLAAHAAIMVLTNALRTVAPNLPEFVSRSLLDHLAPTVRSSGDPDAERQAASIEQLGESIQHFAVATVR